MTNRRSIGDLLRDATHRVPGVPGHRDHDPGHQGRSRPGAGPERAPADEPNSMPTAAPNSTAADELISPPGRRLNERLNHRPTNQGEPRVLVGWQRRIAAFVGRR